MQNYYVTMNITGKFVVKVEADNLKEAMDKAEEICEEKNFDELDSHHTNIDNVEDEHGNCLWEKPLLY